MLPIDDPVIEIAWPPRAGRALAGLEAELAHLAQGLARIAEDPASPWPRATLRCVKADLFLTASLLLPLWRELCTDHAVVDRDEVHIGQLRALADITAAGGDDDPLGRARLAALAEGLARHRQRAAVLLRAVEVRVDGERIEALRSDWHAQRAQMLQALALDQGAEFENEDGDPVGPAAR